MAAARRWVRWTSTKRPVTVSGRAASSTRADTWASHAAVRASRHGVGAGYVLGEGVGCYDLDGALFRGRLTSWAHEALQRIHEPVLFVEVSQSGCGLHVFVSAPPGPGSMHRVEGGSIERYTQGRYIAMTGVPYALPADVCRPRTPLDVARAALTP